MSASLEALAMRLGGQSHLVSSATVCCPREARYLLIACDTIITIITITIVTVTPMNGENQFFQIWGARLVRNSFSRLRGGTGGTLGEQALRADIQHARIRTTDVQYTVLYTVLCN